MYRGRRHTGHATSGAWDKCETAGNLSSGGYRPWQHPGRPVSQLGARHTTTMVGTNTLRYHGARDTERSFRMELLESPDFYLLCDVETHTLERMS